VTDEGDIRFILGRLEGKVDSLIAQTKDLRGTLANHETRLQELEKSRSWLLGVSAASSAVVAVAINYLTN